jgi:outer membrane protein assembly factor BamA
MRKRLFFIAFFVMLAAFAAPAQIRADEKCTGHIYNGDETMKDAARVIKQVLASSGHSDSRVEAQIEHLSATRVNVVFVISSN